MHKTCMKKGSLLSIQKNKFMFLLLYNKSYFCNISLKQIEIIVTKGGYFVYTEATVKKRNGIKIN